MRFPRGPITTVLWKDLILELRTRDVILPVVVFAYLVIVVFNFAIEPRPALVIAVAPGVLWLAFTFASTLALSRTFALEKETGSIEGLLMAPVDPDKLYLAKLLGNVTFLLVVEALTLPLFSALFNLPLFLPELWLLMILSTFGLAAVGTVFSAMAINTHAREILLPVLFFPIIVPVIIAAVEATGAILQGEPWSVYGRWLGLTAAFDAIYLVIGAVTFGYVLKQ